MAGKGSEPRASGSSRVGGNKSFLREGSEHGSISPDTVRFRAAMELSGQGPLDDKKASIEDQNEKIKRKKDKYEQSLNDKVEGAFLQLESFKKLKETVVNEAVKSVGVERNITLPGLNSWDGLNELKDLLVYKEFGCEGGDQGTVPYWSLDINVLKNRPNFQAEELNENTLSGIELYAFESALKHLQDACPASKYISIRSIRQMLGINDEVQNVANNVAMVDFFKRKKGEKVKISESDTHVVILWKSDKGKLVLIDPNNQTFSNFIKDELVNVFPEWSIDSGPNTIVEKKDKGKIYQVECDNKRDCVDIAVKICFELNLQQNILPGKKQCIQETLNNISMSSYSKPFQAFFPIYSSDPEVRKAARKVDVDYKNLLDVSVKKGSNDQKSINSIAPITIPDDQLKEFLGMDYNRLKAEVESLGKCIRLIGEIIQEDPMDQ